ncbi:MAG: hypothetical protein GOVbin564_2 [Prokaryotic dsDNA virus sp.]|nr:MAG: hypothetical protein GOVbin564_2 [Prokaryotic dsDNA virus sp.]|tara:strand:+ start:24244 stop:25320 length:1077 start_codon:yes stop_codon:yes gene_type:complete
MSNTFTSPPNVPDTSDLIAGRVITTTTLARMGDLSNYLHAHGSTSNCISQAFDANTCVTNSTSFVDLCRWRVPIPSNDHTTIQFHVAARVTSTGTGTLKFTLTDANSVAQGNSSISITSTASTYAHATVSHTFTSSTTAVYVDIVMQGKVDANTYDVDVQVIAARFTALTSPLSAGNTAQGSDKITPFGASRLGANNALSSRAGVQWRTNIQTLRSRKRPLLIWSGIQNADATPSAFTGRGQSPKSLGVGDCQSMQVQSPLFIGGGSITLWIYVVNISGTKKFAFMNRLFSVTSNGWNEFNFTPSLENTTLESVVFGFPLYKINPTAYVESDTLLDSADRLAVSLSLPRITALSVWSN